MIISYYNIIYVKLQIIYYAYIYHHHRKQNATLEHVLVTNMSAKSDLMYIHSIGNILELELLYISK